MWRLPSLALLTLLLSASAFGQFTTTSGTITDTPDGQAWFGGTYSFVFRVSPSNPTAQYFWNGVPFSSAQTIAGALDGSAHYSVSVPSNTSITPAGSTWDVTFCPLATAACLTVQSVSVTGTTQTFSPSPASVRINMGSPAPNTRAYRDGELVNGALGQAYFNVTDTLIHVCNTLPCTVWTPINFGGVVNVITAPSGACTPGSVPEQVISTGVIYTCQASVWAPIASSGAAAGTTGQYQLNNAGVLGVGNLSESGGTLTNGDNNNNRGPNLGVDITYFGGRPVFINIIPTTTCTISATSTSLAVASATGFQKGDGVACIGAGPTNNGTPPLAPTVTPYIATSLTGTGWGNAGGAGSTPYCYVLIADSKGGGYTAAGALGCTTTGNASLGPNNMPITSCSNSLGTVTCTVGSTANLGPNGTVAHVNFTGTSDDKEFAGYHTITVTSGTQFTFASGYSSLYYMASTSSTGGTMYYWLSNHLTFPLLPSGTNMFQFAAYRCQGTSVGCALPANAASYSLVYLSYPAGLGYSDAAYNTWDDYGSTMTPNLGAGFTSPWFIPTTPPATNVNDMLVTTITNISGNTLTVANAATNSVSASPMRFDDAPAITACIAASTGQITGSGGSCHIPPVPFNSVTGNGYYVTSSYLFANAQINQGALLALGYTMELSAGWNGTYENSQWMINPAFSPQSEIQLWSNGANPAIWRKSGRISNISFGYYGAGAIGVFDNSSGPNVTENYNSYIISGANDWMGIAYYYYNDVAGSGTFGGTLRKTSFTSSSPQTRGATNTPQIIVKGGSEWNIDYMTLNLRGIYMEINSANTANNFGLKARFGEEWQGPITPMLAFNNANGGNFGGVVNLQGLVNDSGSECEIDNASTAGTIGSPLYIDTTGAPASNTPIFCGKPWSGGINLTAGGPFTNIGINQLGTNHDFTDCTQANLGLTTNYTGCQLPALNTPVLSYSANHTLNGSEGAVNATATLTFTIPHLLAGQRWDVHSQAGTTTLAIDAGGTLYGNNSTGSFVIPNGSGVVVDVDNSGNAHATGGGGGSGGCSPGGIANALQYNGGGTCSFGGVNSPTTNGNYVVNYNVTASAAVPPTITLPGIPVNPQTGTTYTYLYSDRGSLVTANNSGAQTYTLVNPSTAGFGFNYFNALKNIGTNKVTETASGFTVNGGASLITPQNWTRWLWSDGVNYFASRFPDFSAFPTCVDTGGNHVNFDPTALPPIFCGTSASGNGLSGMTAGQVAIAATATSVTSSFPLSDATGAAITTGPASATSGDVAQFSGVLGKISDTGQLFTNVVRTNAAFTFGAFLYDFSASTINLPTAGGFTASATSKIGYDSTNKNPHIYDNGADALICAFASAPSNNNIVIATVASSNVLCSGTTALPNGTTSTTQAAGDSTTDVATDAFVTTAVNNAIAAVNPAVAVLAATTGSNLTGTYSNGASGIGATFTITATGAFTLDGVAINTIGQRVLLKDQTSAFQNGVYTATIVGTTGISAVFTRALDYDQPSDMNTTGAIPVQSGTVNASTSWLLTSTVNTVGTDALTYVQFTIAPTNLSQKIANGTAAMGTSAISSGACATVVTVSATGVATTDVITVGFNGDPTAVTGYGASATGAVLTIYPYPTANNVNFKVCNSSSGSITPSALTLNWKVTR